MAIARAFIKKPRVLLFDEATSALDRKNEIEVQKAIDAIGTELGQVTTIVIAHRLSTIKNADKILVMSKGDLVEEGTHDELLSKEGVYAGLVKLQESANSDVAAEAAPALEKQASKKVEGAKVEQMTPEEKEKMEAMDQ